MSPNVSRYPETVWRTVLNVQLIDHGRAFRNCHARRQLDGKMGDPTDDPEGHGNFFRRIRIYR